MSESRENKMGVLPIPKLLISMSVPVMFSMLIQALYNIVDSIFVAQISSDKLELTAVSVAFPLQSLIIAFSAGIGVGMTALISRSLGEKRADRAGKAAAQGILIQLICYLIFLFIGIFGVRAFFESQTDNSLIVEYGCQYLSICCIFSIGVFIQVTFEKILQSAGKMMLSMVTQLSGAIVNIILDPIFIFGWFGAPAMGIRGAAVATVVGQTVAGAVALICHFTKNKEIRMTMADFKPHAKSIIHILTVGLPSVAMMAIGSVMTYLLNKILFSFKNVGEIAATVFGIYFKLQSFVFMPCFGLNNGMLPIVAYNYGAKNRKRITNTIKLAVIIAMSIMAVGIAVFQLMPDKLLLMFDCEDEMMALGCKALRAISLCFVMAGYNIIMTGTFQAFGNGIFSLIISFVRQIVVLIPSAFILSKVATVNEVWYAFPIAELSALVLCTTFFMVIYKNKIKKLPAEA